ncbi:MAG: glycosyltransferase [Methylovulum miyakonense]|uniref:glycosyltransferase n=1 Tax=Methylovulum miyakonense TaxID=645578 RepID=UPI003BB5AB8B
MKLSLIISSFYPATIYGGPIFSSLYTCQALAKLENVEVRVSTTNTNMTSRLDVSTNEWITFADNFYVKYYNETKIDKFSLPLCLNIWKDIKTADVIHLQGVFNTQTPVALLFSTFYKKPVLFSPRGALGEWCLKNGSGFKQKWLNWFIKPFAKKMIWHATSEQEKSEIISLFPDSKIEIIPNGIDYDLFQKSNILTTNQFITQFAQNNVDTDKIIISMGRLQKKKGFDILITAFAQVLENYPAAKLLIAGQDEGEKRNLEQQIATLGLNDKVFLIGSITEQDKIDFLANADLFVLPSHNENFGNVYVESLAAGTPIVASKHTPWSEVMDADCGQWVNNNAEETASAIIFMLQKDREQMRSNSKKLAQKYDWKNIAIQFKNTFEEML